MDVLQHRVERQNVYEEIPKFWHDLYGTEYALLDVKVESRKTVQNIREAAERAGLIFAKTAKLMRQLPDETFRELGFPPETWSYIRLKTLPFESVIARIDFAVNGNEIKLLELNADTPTFIKETYRVNGEICRYHGLQDVNEEMEKVLAGEIRKAVEIALKQSGKGPYAKIVFTSHDDHEEDYWTVQYLMEISGLGAEYVALKDLRIIETDLIENSEVILPRGVYTPTFEKIDVLYRQTYPIEHLILDEDPITKEKVGIMLLKLAEENEVLLLNPPSAFLLQSKSVLALIWGLHEQKHPYFSRVEHEWISRYFLPTYLEEDNFLLREVKYVKKPSFGREGDTVEVFNGRGKKVIEDRLKTYEDTLPVYQQFVELPDYEIKTISGRRLAKIMYGCFLINGKPSAIGIRAGGQITNNASYFLPIGLVKEED